MAKSDSMALRSVLGFLPQHRRYQLLDEAFDAVRRAYTRDHGPEAGDPPTPADFADDLAVEFRERLFQLVGARAQVYLLGSAQGPASGDVDL